MTRIINNTCCVCEQIDLCSILYWQTDNYASACAPPGIPGPLGIYLDPPKWSRCALRIQPSHNSHLWRIRVVQSQWRPSMHCSKAQKHQYRCILNSGACGEHPSGITPSTELKRSNTDTHTPVVMFLLIPLKPETPACFKTTWRFIKKSLKHSQIIPV